MCPGPADKKANKEMGSPVGAWAVTIVRYAALFALLGGIATIVVGLYTMTPETANGRGSIPVISDGTLPVDLAPEPVGINDVPGAKGAMESVGGTVGKGVDAVDSGAKARLVFEAGLRNAGQVPREGENRA